MKKKSFRNFIILVFSILFSINLTNCKKTENPIKFPIGTFPDTVNNLAAINSAYDDYNLSLYQLNGKTSIIFSSNRASKGGQFDLEQAIISFVFDQTTGEFKLSTEMSNDAFISKLITKAKTAGNDFGPYRFYSSLDGFEYLLLSSANGAGNLDLFYLKNTPVFGSNLPDINGPYPIKLLNTSSDDAYICFDANQDTAFFASNRSSNFDIYFQKRPAEKEISSWFNLDFTFSTRVDSINTLYDDKCPMVFKNIMVLTSNRPDGFGGFDLYYSVFRKGKWSSPVNFGQGINTSSDEYRPIVVYNPDFENLFLMFSSNRSGGKGGFDLYFAGVKFPD